jgi:hypothetical protein
VRVAATLLSIDADPATSFRCVEIVLASHVVLHDAHILELHTADVTLGRAGIRCAMLVTHMTPQAARVIIPLAYFTLHPALHTAA